MSSSLVLSFAVLLLIGVLVSERAHRTVLSTAVLFLLGGFALGQGAFGVISVGTGEPIIGGLAELALFSVLFTDGMRVGLSQLRTAWRLPGRALVLGLPLTLGATALLAHYVPGLPWLEAFLIGAVLAPTDPVFAAAIVGGTDAHGWQLAEEIGLGVLVGAAVPFVVLALERLPFLQATKSLQPLLAVSIPLLVLAISHATHADLFLAAFTAGVTVATMGRGLRHEFEQFGELITELLKLATIMVFGALIPPARLSCSRRSLSPDGCSQCWHSWRRGRWHCWFRFWARAFPSSNRSQPCGSGQRDLLQWSTSCSSSNRALNWPTMSSTSLHW